MIPIEARASLPPAHDDVDIAAGADGLSEARAFPHQHAAAGIADIDAELGDRAGIMLGGGAT
jgi:hypothetical protein